MKDSDIESSEHNLDFSSISIFIPSLLSLQGSLASHRIFGGSFSRTNLHIRFLRVLSLMNSFGTSQDGCSSLPQPVNSLQSPTSSDGNSTSFQTSKENEKMGHKKIFGRERSTFAFRIREHVKLGPKLSETLKGKLSLGSKIIQEGGRGNIFKRIFGMKDDEQLLKASQCYLYTTAGPIAGILFISTEKVAFCSERSINFSSSAGDLVSAPYKVLIPIGKIKEANESQNVNKLEQKYIEIVTKDGSEFWFLGFLRYEKALRNLQKAISMAN